MTQISVEKKRRPTFCIQPYTYPFAYCVVKCFKHVLAKYSELQSQFSRFFIHLNFVPLCDRDFLR